MGIMSTNYGFSENGYHFDGPKSFYFAKRAVYENPLEDPYDLFQLASCYDEAIGVSQDWATALYWYGKCEDNFAEAANSIALIYFQGGYGVKMNCGKGAHYFLKGVGLGSAQAQYNLAGKLYRNGMVFVFACSQNIFRVDVVFFVPSSNT